MIRLETRSSSVFSYWEYLGPASSLIAARDEPNSATVLLHSTADNQEKSSCPDLVTRGSEHLRASPFHWQDPRCYQSTARRTQFLKLNFLTVVSLMTPSTLLTWFTWWEFDEVVFIEVIKLLDYLQGSPLPKEYFHATLHNQSLGAYQAGSENI